MKIIKIFTEPSCPHCAGVRKLLFDNNIHFTEIDITLPETHFMWEEVLENTGIDFTPTISIEIFGVTRYYKPTYDFTTDEDILKLVK